MKYDSLLTTKYVQKHMWVYTYIYKHIHVLHAELYEQVHFTHLFHLEVSKIKALIPLFTSRMSQRCRVSSKQAEGRTSI